MIQHIAFGIIVDDIVCPDGTTHLGVLGGGGPQTAWGMAAAAGTGAAVGLVAGIGADLDDTILAPMRAAGINLDGVRITGHPTPRAWQLVELDGRRTQEWRVPVQTLGVQLARTWDILPDTYRAARTFHWGIHPGEDRSLAFAHDLLDRGYRVSLEPFKPSDRPLPDAELRALFAACEVFSPNWHEAVGIMGTDDTNTLLARCRDLGCRVLALRRGADGADVWDLTTGRGVHVPAVQTDVVDVVGAGNTFCGAFVARLEDGIETAACHASATASYLIEQVGIPAALPDPADYARRLDEARAGLRKLARS